MQDIILINKPRGMSSFGVIREMRTRLGIEKIGHAGTLDPLAEGLLIVGLGRGTKKLTQLVGMPKTYIFEVLFGQQTSTGDLEGEVVKERAVTRTDLKKLKKVLADLPGKVRLAVPFYSAIKVKGKPLYQYARQGLKVKVPKREMELYSLELLSLRSYNKYQVVKIQMRCNSGTYVRTISEEIGRRLGLPATAKSITRIAIGDFKLEQAYDLEDIDRRLLER